MNESLPDTCFSWVLHWRWWPAHRRHARPHVQKKYSPITNLLAKSERKKFEKRFVHRIFYKRFFIEYSMVNFNKRSMNQNNLNWLLKIKSNQIFFPMKSLNFTISPHLLCYLALFLKLSSFFSPGQCANSKKPWAVISSKIRVNIWALKTNSIQIDI